MVPCLQYVPRHPLILLFFPNATCPNAVATSILALPTATSSSGTDGNTTTVQSIPTPVATSKPRVKPPVQPDPAPTRQTARILERGNGYRKPDSIQFLTLCQAYLLQVEEHQCPMYAAFCYWITNLA